MVIAGCCLYAGWVCLWGRCVGQVCVQVVVPFGYIHPIYSQQLQPQHHSCSQNPTQPTTLTPPTHPPPPAPHPKIPNNNRTPPSQPVPQQNNATACPPNLDISAIVYIVVYACWLGLLGGCCWQVGHGFGVGWGCVGGWRFGG